MNETKQRLDSHLDWDTLAGKRPLPVQFALYGSQRIGKALCAALVVRVDGVEIIRILDPEHKEPFFSLEGIFALAGMTIVEGLLHFDLRRDRGDFDLTLAGFEPREGIWASWKVSVDVVERLGMDHLFKTLFASHLAWSLDEGADGITHNWRGLSDNLDASAYSLASLLDTPLNAIQVLPRGQQIRTFVSLEQRQKILEDSKPVFLLLGRESEQRQENWRVEQRLLRWSVWSVEKYLDVVEESIHTPAVELEGEVNDVQTSDHLSNGDIEPFDIGAADIAFLLSDMLPQPYQRDSVDIQPGLKLSVGASLAQALNQYPHSSEAALPARIPLLLTHQFSRLYVDRAVATARHHLAASAPSRSFMNAEPTDPTQNHLDQLLSSNERIETSLSRLLTAQGRSKDANSQKRLFTGAPATASSSSPWKSALYVIVAAMAVNLIVQALLSYS